MLFEDQFIEAFDVWLESEDLLEGEKYDAMVLAREKVDYAS